jgi:hypothetical protein
VCAVHETPHRKTCSDTALDNRVEGRSLLFCDRFLGRPVEQRASKTPGGLRPGLVFGRLNAS